MGQLIQKTRINSNLHILQEYVQHQLASVRVSEPFFILPFLRRKLLLLSSYSEYLLLTTQGLLRMLPLPLNSDLLPSELFSRVHHFLHVTPLPPPGVLETSCLTTPHPSQQLQGRMASFFLVQFSRGHTE